MGIAPGICKIDTNVAMLSGTVIAIAIEFIRRKPGKEILKDLESFWSGMTENFASVILLIVAADIFAKGLISLGFISGLTSTCMHFGLGGAGIGVVMSIMIFLASILMGSGNAAFFAFGPLVPEIAASLSYDSVKIILPMAFAASMGRTVSPIAGILVAIAGIAKVSPMDIVKRNLIPLCLGLVVMLCINFLF
jgi:DcuC family C4-dicarboxylate transporter